MESKINAPIDVYTSKQRADKAINSLKGILLGINLDQEVNEKELIELRKWATLNKVLVNRNPFKEFMDVINSTIDSDMPKNEAVEDLYWLCQKYENESVFYSAVTADLQILQGLCHGILSDGRINEKEIFNLHAWLEANEHLNSYYPYDEIRSLVLSIVSDNKVDAEEILILKAYLKQFVNINNKTIDDQLSEETNGVNIMSLCSSDPKIEFENKRFCITGILKRGNRESLELKIIALGGKPTNSIGLKTDYLIVGDNGNPAWAFCCYGRKVEKAMNLRKAGHTIMLVHEFDFSDAIDDLI